MHASGEPTVLLLFITVELAGEIGGSALPFHGAEKGPAKLHGLERMDNGQNCASSGQAALLGVRACFQL